MANPYAPQKLANRPNLTPEQLLALQQNVRGGSAYNTGGMDWTNNGFAGTGEGNVGAQDATEYYASAPGQTGEVHPYSVYDLQGNYKGDSSTHPVDFKKSFAQWAAMAAAMAGGLGALGMVGAGGVGAGFGAGAGTGLGGAGAGLSEAGLAGEGAFGATNALGGAGALGPEATAYYGSTGLLSGGAPAWTSAAADSQLANAAIDAGGGNSLAGYSAAGATPSSVSIGGTTYGAGAPSSAWMDKAKSLMNGTGGRALLAGASLLGGGAGGGGGDGTTERHMDPRMDGAVFGEGGMVPRAQGLLALQMTPEMQEGNLQMMNQGRGLLGQPIAQNGFNRFYPGR